MRTRNSCLAKNMRPREKTCVPIRVSESSALALLDSSAWVFKGIFFAYAIMDRYQTLIHCIYQPISIQAYCYSIMPSMFTVVSWLPVPLVLQVTGPRATTVNIGLSIVFVLRPNNKIIVGTHIFFKYFFFLEKI